MKTPPLAMTHDNFCAIVDPRSPNPKTETRRLLKIRDLSQELTNELKSFYQDGDGNWIGCSDDSPNHAEFILREYPKGSNKGIKSPLQIGDRCYLTEPTRIVFAPDQSLYYQIEYFWHDPKTIQKLVTQDDIAKVLGRKTGIYSKQIARFMLKSFARYWVEIVDVKLERLFDITAEAAIAEGVKCDNRFGWYFDYMDTEHTNGAYKPNFTPIQSYLSEIEMLHGKAIANSNPWLWVYKFKFIGNNKG